MSICQFCRIPGRCSGELTGILVAAGIRCGQSGSQPVAWWTTDDVFSLTPIYVRKSEAEVRMSQLEGEGGFGAENQRDEA